MRSFLLLLLFTIFGISAFAQGNTLEASIPPGKNFDKAEFRLWYDNSTRINGLIVLMPGSNGDARDMVADPFWQGEARKHGFGLIGCRFTDKQHKNMDIEEYVDVKQGSGQALLSAISFLAGQSKHPELENAPLLLWGFSAGGEYNYEFVCWKPERVIAFVVNKGGIYYSALAPEAAREVPGLLCTGTDDLESRTSIIKGIFEANRRFGAVWCYAAEPGLQHEVGKSQLLAAMFFDKMIALRVPAQGIKNGKVSLLPVPPAGGYMGSYRSQAYLPATQNHDPNASWLPDTQFADAWLLFIKGELK